MDNLNLTPIQQERLIDRDILMLMDLDEIIDEVAFMDAISGFIDEFFTDRRTATYK